MAEDQIVVRILYGKFCEICICSDFSDLNRLRLTNPGILVKNKFTEFSKIFKKYKLFSNFRKFQNNS